MDVQCAAWNFVVWLNTTCSVFGHCVTLPIVSAGCLGYSEPMLATISSFADIEEEALELQREMWDRQYSFWPGQKLTRLDMCDPWRAAEYLDFEVQEGYLTDPNGRVGVQLGGFLNRPFHLIAIADHLKPTTKRFTLAHELGHVLIHPTMHEHRELPIHGLGEPREPTEPKEKQANHFAGCFLVPGFLLKRAFKAAFRVEQLTLRDDVCQELLGGEFMMLMNSPPSSLAFERRIASVERFQGRQFDSLCTLFKVHPTTMAMRLRQCGLTRR